ncbi:DUF4390 domain-containing protein [Variovorax terrae]|uniref:DUF4390 domain-containing protein n=1 Tax=Variovorax terrae TaxID=2923278 RepID=A0A9X1VYQ5_9BURK|nr:DUF4390 domain-containing protein [Variovorax terrae]MCJ0766111.1 DUF4390 domain-containing protein [Variovorax terrae]
MHRGARIKTGLERLLLLWCVCTALLLPAAARAEAGAAEVSQLQLERTEEGVFLSAAIRFELSAIVEDALLKGIPMYFVAEAELFRDRWYWYDKKVTLASRHMRLAYQPLTRRWRLNVSPGPIGNAGLGVTFNQNFDSLADALAAIQRISRWKIADASEVDADARYNADFRFKLDVSQLPRPFQIGAVGQSDWSISASRNQRLTAESAK